MKRALYAIAAALLLFSCTPREHEGFTISGKFLDIDGIATLGYTDPVTKEYIRDTSSLEKGAFRFEGSVSEPTFGQIIYIAEDGTRHRSSIVVENYDLYPAEDPGEMIIDGDKILTLRNLSYYGGPNNDLYANLDKCYARLDEVEEYKGIRDIIAQMNNCGYHDLNKYLELRSKLYDLYGKKTVEKYEEDKIEAARKYVRKHNNIEMSAYILQQCNVSKMTLEELETEFGHLTPKVQNSFIATNLRSILEDKRKSAAK